MVSDTARGLIKAGVCISGPNISSSSKGSNNNYSFSCYCSFLLYPLRRPKKAQTISFVFFLTLDPYPFFLEGSNPVGGIPDLKL